MSLSADTNTVATSGSDSRRATLTKQTDAFDHMDGMHLPPLVPSSESAYDTIAPLKPKPVTPSPYSPRTSPKVG